MNTQKILKNQSKIQQGADKILAKNQKWAKSRVGKKAMKVIVGDGYDPKELAEWGLEHEIRMAREVLGDKKVKEIIKAQLK